MQHQRHLAAFAVLALSLAAGAAHAGPDWDVIQRARAAKAADTAAQAPAEARYASLDTLPAAAAGTPDVSPVDSASSAPKAAPAPSLHARGLGH